MLTKIKKVTLSLLCIVVLFAGIALPQKTYAIPTFDAALNALTATNAYASAAEWVTQLTKWVKEELWKTLRDQIVKAIVNEINKQTVAWIQGKGKPKFVSDWQGFLKNAAMEGVNQTISQSQLADLCTPFAFQLRIALIPETAPISQQAKCTISDIVANVEDFYDNFENGGWLAYGASANPENNLYMQLVMFDDDMRSRASKNEDKKKQEAGAGSGFLSVNKCVADDQQELYDYCVDNNYFDTGDPNYCYTYAAENQTCTKEEVQTPGDAVAGAVKNMIGSDNIYVSGVQSIISAAINAGINRMMKEGLSLMTGDEHPENGFNPATQFQDQIDAINADGKRDFIDQIQPYYDQWKTLKDVNTKSSTYNSQLRTNLEAIKTIQTAGVLCPPQVTDQELKTIGDRGLKLIAEASVLQTKLDDAQKVLDMINKATLTKTKDTLDLKTAIKDFQAKYNKEVITGTGSIYPKQLQDAQDQADKLAAELDLVLTRLQTCKTAQGPAATQAVQ